MEGCVIIMEYVIRNHKKLYIALNKNGRAETCSEQNKGVFTEEKAKHIVNSLPKTLKRLDFKVYPLQETTQMLQVKKEKIQRKVIEAEGYELSKDILAWVDKFGTCSDIIKEAQNRSEYLIKVLEDTDMELVDILHKIEMEPAKGLYDAWKTYKRIRENRKKRREAKDEMIIIRNVLRKVDVSCMDREMVQRAIDGLFKRKYTYRIIEEESEDVVQTM